MTTSATPDGRAVVISDKSWEVLRMALGYDLHGQITHLGRSLAEFGEEVPATLAPFADEILGVAGSLPTESGEAQAAQTASTVVRADLASVGNRLADRPEMEADDLRNLVRFVTDDLDAIDAIGWNLPPTRWSGGEALAAGDKGP